jgi:hypothetical protein
MNKFFKRHIFLRKTVLTAVMLGCAVLASCATYGITYENGKAWPGKFTGAGVEMRGTLRLGTVEVDKPGGSYSIEREINAILPLVFWEMGYFFEPATGNADYIVDVYARERDVPYGWKTKKSISLEVVLWPVQSVVYAGGQDVKTPFAAGRTVIAGTAGLSASGNTESLLRKTVRKAVKAAQMARIAQAAQEYAAQEHGEDSAADGRAYQEVFE